MFLSSPNITENDCTANLSSNNGYLVTNLFVVLDFPILGICFPLVSEDSQASKVLNDS